KVRYAVAGFDYTFNPAKSVSVLWALAHREVREQITAAHHAAGGDPTATTVAPTDPTTPTGPGTTPTTAPSGTGLLTPAQKVAQAGKPNLMVIVMDDMRVEGLMDNPTVLPMTKQWLSAAGSTYSEGYATTPLCCPERATIWTGRLPHNHGVVDNYDGAPLNKDWIVPRYLHDAGYRTALVGKFITDWHHKYDPPHFDEFAAFQGGYLDVPFKVKNPGATATVGERTSDDGPATDNSSDYIGKKVNQFVDAYEANDAQPWYMHVTPHAPHDDVAAPFFKWPARHNDVEVSPYEPNPAASIEGLDSPTAKAEKADKARRIRSQLIDRSSVETYHEGMLKTLLAADEMLDSIFKNLQAKGELDNTLVVFTSDNGFSWGERGVDSKGWPYAEDVKVPFLARWDGVIAAGATNTIPVGGEDILPTMLDAAQYTPPTFGQTIDGRSFLPGQPAKDVKFLEFGPRVGTSPSTSCSDATGPDCYAAHRGIPTWASLRTPTYQYLEWYDEDNTTIQADNGKEYYDLVVDPYQLNNLLADGNPANDPDVAGLSSRLHSLRTCTGTSGPAACP
ncbi:MAG: sulfatase-like hydrolase/transferase, partial [Acidimicrobiia bacterium]